MVHAALGTVRTLPVRQSRSRHCSLQLDSGRCIGRSCEIDCLLQQMVSSSIRAERIGKPRAGACFPLAEPADEHVIC